jgi:hypothetical protein
VLAIDHTHVLAPLMLPKLHALTVTTSPRAAAGPGIGFDPDDDAAGLSRRELNRVLRDGPSTS